MQVIYDFWNKLWGNEEPKKEKKPIPMTKKTSVEAVSTPGSCFDNPSMDTKPKRMTPENSIFQIQRKQISETTFSDTIDGEKYIVNYGEKIITITKPDNSIETIDIEQLMKSSTPKEREKMMQYLRGQNAGVLSDLASEAAYAHYFPEGYNKEGSYNPAYEELQINPNSLNHELAHALDNYDNVIKAIRLINNPKGLNIGARHISISTSGVVPKIYELADRQMQCTLSVSLHSSNNKTRSEMMPVNNAYPIEELIKACKYYIEKTNKRISFEYALAKDNNDNLNDAKDLVKLLKGMLAHVNLIPINKIEDGKYTKSTNENIIKFRDYLNDHGIVATIRRELGADISAACGQLRKQNLKK